MVVGRKEISVLLLAIGALLFFMVFILSVSSDAQTGGGSTGGPTSAQRNAPPAPNQNFNAQAQADAGGASAKSSRERQRRNVVRGTVPRRPLPPTGGPPVSLIVAGFVLTGTGILGTRLVVRRGGRRR